MENPAHLSEADKEGKLDAGTAMHFTVPLGI